MVYLFLCAVIGLLIAYIISNEFYQVAIDKGYPDKKYFWICFFLGMMGGYLLIIALPDLRHNKSQGSNTDKYSDSSLSSADELPDL